MKNFHFKVNHPFNKLHLLFKDASLKTWQGFGVQKKEDQGMDLPSDVTYFHQCFTKHVRPDR